MSIKNYVFNHLFDTFRLKCCRYHFYQQNSQSNANREHSLTLRDPDLLFLRKDSELQSNTVKAKTAHFITSEILLTSHKIHKISFKDYV